MRVKRFNTMYLRSIDLSQFPNFHKSGSIRGMKKLYYGQNALLVRHGDFIYNVTERPEIYYGMSV